MWILRESVDRVSVPGGYACKRSDAWRISDFTSPEETSKSDTSEPMLRPMRRIGAQARGGDGRRRKTGRRKTSRRKTQDRRAWGRATRGTSAGSFSILEPRDLPWAGMFHPVGAEIPRRRSPRPPPCPLTSELLSANEALRLSWCHWTSEVDCPPSGQPGCVLRTVFREAQMRLLDWEAVAGRVKGLR